MLYLLLFSIQAIDSFRTNLNRRGIQIEVNKQSSRLRTKSTSDSWYFVHFDTIPDYSLLSKQGININTHNMINKLWYSLFLTPTQAQSLSKIASLRPILQKEKIIDSHLLKYSDYIQFEVSSTFNPSQDLPTNLHVDKVDANIYQFRNPKTPELSQTLSHNDKVYSIWPINETVYFNGRAAGYTQYNSQVGLASSTSKDIVSINRVLEKRGLTGSGEIIMIADSYLDTNSTFFYDKNHPVVENEQLIDDHRKIVYMYATELGAKDKLNAHGTHVAGCAAGATHLAASASDMHYYDGVARDAKIAFSMNNFEGIVSDVISKTKPCVSSNSWGQRGMLLSADNTWNRIAKQFDETLIIFAAGNFGGQNNLQLDFYETAISPCIGKNLLTVGALSPVPIDNADSFEKQIYIFSYKPAVKKWSLRSDASVKNPSADELFAKGTVSDAKVTYDINEDFSKKKRILVIKGKDEFLKINKEKPPFMAISITDFDCSEEELKQFKQLFPVVVLDNESINAILDFSTTVYVETNLVDSKLANITRATYSSKGLSEVGLMKPEIMAPGTAMISARSDPNGGFGHADYMTMDGTSMATPNVAGATTLVSQYFKSGKYRPNYSAKPSASLLKAVLINAADPLNRSAPHPNADTGFGQLNLGRYILNAGISPKADEGDTKVLVGDHIQVNGDQHLYAEVSITNKDEDFRVTITYLDEVLSDDSSAALAVDLDLVVVAPDGKTVYRGNQRVDNTEEMFSTIERVIVKSEDVQTGIYEIHVFSHIPLIVPGQKSEFSIAVFGSISYSDGDTITFSPATKCVPVVEGNGKCNSETTLNECSFDDMEGDGYNGHSCQNVIIAMNDGFETFRQKKIIELEPYGTKYVHGYMPMGEGSLNMTLIVSSVTDFHPKYAYMMHAKEHNPLMREIDADSVQMKGDFAGSIVNFKHDDYELKSGVYVLVYNKSPKKTKFIVSYTYSVDDYYGDDTPTPEPTSVPPKTETKEPVPVPVPSSSPVVVVEKEVIQNDYFIPFIIAIVACVILFVVVVVFAVLFLRRRTTDLKSNEVTDSLHSPLF